MVSITFRINGYHHLALEVEMPELRYNTICARYKSVVVFWKRGTHCICQFASRQHYREEGELPEYLTVLSYSFLLCTF